jgi:hypothetical protein
MKMQMFYVSSGQKRDLSRKDQGGNGQGDDRKRHDPLLSIASPVCGAWLVPLQRQAIPGPSYVLPGSGRNRTPQFSSLG